MKQNKIILIAMMFLQVTCTAADHLELKLPRALGDSKADRAKSNCDDVPKAFRKAKHPYAKKPDGCSGYQSPKEVRDTWGKVSFKSACDTHDRCYYTLKSSWKKCNKNFAGDLAKACRNDLRIRLPDIIGFERGRIVKKRVYLPPEPHALVLCLKLVAAYYTAVQAGVAFGVFEDAQDLQRKYLKWYNSCH